MYEASCGKNETKFCYVVNVWKAFAVECGLFKNTSLTPSG